MLPVFPQSAREKKALLIYQYAVYSYKRNHSMNTSFETLLSAFSEHIPPNSIVEQSLRTVYDLIKKGDTITAQSILRYINVPEALKSQLLGLNTEEKNTPPNVSAKDSDGKAFSSELLATAQPETITKESDDDIPIKKDTTIPSPLSSIDTSVSAPAPLSDLDSAFAAVTREVHTEPVPVKTNPPPGTDPNANVPLLDLATQKQIKDKQAPPEPTAVLSQDRQELFQDIFSGVRVADAEHPSQPTVDTSIPVSVIHTYAESEPSAFAERMQNRQDSEKGSKIFSVFEKFLSRAEGVNDIDVMDSALRQWENVNQQYPEYKTFHAIEWNSMNSRIQKISENKNLISSTILVADTATDLPIPPKETLRTETYKDIPIVKESTESYDMVDTLSVDTILAPEPVPEAIETIPLTWEPSPEMVTQIQDPVESQQIPMSTVVDTTSVEPYDILNTVSVDTILAPEPVPLVQPDSQDDDSEYFDMTALGSDETNPLATKSDTQPANAYANVFPDHQDIKPLSTQAEPIVDSPPLDTIINQLESTTLPSGIVIKRNLTITGDSVYRVRDIEQKGNSVNVIFTDEVHTFTVPLIELDNALNSSTTDPDVFFNQYLQ